MTANVKLISNTDGAFSSYLKLLQQKKELDKAIASSKAAILDIIDGDASMALSDNDYGCGTVNIKEGNYDVKYTVSKKVTWDQEKLQDLFSLIENSGGDPLEYIDVKYSVLENRYKNWPERIKDQFSSARTVSQSKPTIDVKESD